MKYVGLGASGLKVSSISLGSWLTYGSSVDLDTTEACVRAALDRGVITFDTADVYDKGKAETALGRVFERLGLRRQDMVLATKAFWPMSDNANDRGLSRKHLSESLAASLERLGTDYIDLYQCHRHDADTPIEEVVRTMDNFIRQGRVLYWGVSCWGPAQLKEACDIADHLRAPRPISNQPPYSLVRRSIEADVMPLCSELGMQQVVFSPLGQGLLTGKYKVFDVPAGSRAADERRGSFLRPLLIAENLRRVEALAPLAADAGLTMAGLAVAFTLAHRNVASAIVGATRPEQLSDTLAAADVTLDHTILAELDRLFPPASDAPTAD